ncbi:MAG: hypothetical protein KJ927_10275 [Candidatus Eisenbacteria bacterium]|nr:hypothetical protein [Candidatus Eisenbacteria bacterium]MBU1949086.1 hypothetical protein [Candidatus Eisenbacteria bacterium]
MSQQETKKLTEKQQYWLNHIETCERNGQTLKSYAIAQNLDVQPLYNWKTRLRAMGFLSHLNSESGREPRSQSTRIQAKTKFKTEDVGFAAVRLAGHDERVFGIRIRFANGILLELGSATGSRPDFNLLSFLAALP